MYAFEVSKVSKSFGEVKALQNVSLKAEKGTIFGLLGPNGAGKTTIVRMLSTLSEPDKGQVQVLGKDVVTEADAVRKVIGLAGQFAAVDEFQTGRENITMVGGLYHLSKKEIKERTNKLLKELRLEDAADRPVRTYSGGMRRRLDLGASLVGNPDILFLDEPTTGLDPRTRLELWAIIKELVAGGTSILLTTQYLEEADELADTIVVIDQGKVIAEGTSDELKRHYGGDVVEVELHSEADAERAVKALKTLGKETPKYEAGSTTVSLPTKDGSKALVEVIRALDSAKLTATGVSLHRPSLDDVFLSLTGKPTSPTAATPKKDKR